MATAPARPPEASPVEIVTSPVLNPASPVVTLTEPESDEAPVFIVLVWTITEPESPVDAAEPPDSRTTSPPAPWLEDPASIEMEPPVPAKEVPASMLMAPPGAWLCDDPEERAIAPADPEELTDDVLPATISTLPADPP